VTLSTPWMQVHVGTIVCKFGGDRVMFVVEVAICAKKFTDGRTDRRTTDASRLHKLTHGLVGASAWGPAYSWYTVNTYSIIHSVLAHLTWRAYARGLYSRRCRASPGVLTHASRAASRATHGTHSRAWRPSAACQKRS